jgi:glycosyltransferase involved in cell wall biosynthesis
MAACPGGRRQSPRVLFLAYGSPWPPRSGASLRTMGLLRELGRRYPSEIVVMSRKPLDSEQTRVLGESGVLVAHVPMLDRNARERGLAAAEAAVRGLPYHSAVLMRSLRASPHVLGMIMRFDGIVFTSTGHWGTLVGSRAAPGWILNQCDADVDLWHVYANITRNAVRKGVMRANAALAARLYPRIYRNVSCVVSVCEEDGELTRRRAPEARIEVVPNGVDCSYYVPSERHSTGHRLLFTGTSAPRNVAALQWFARGALPRIRADVPDIDFVVAGAFQESAQKAFRDSPCLRFTGRVPDIRPFFASSDVFVAPFLDSHGSKLKVAEAMAMGMAIVATSKGARGFPLEHERSALIADSPEDFAAACVSLLSSPERRLHLGREARQLAMEHLDLPKIGERLAVIVESVAETLGATGRVSTSEP